MEIIIQLATHDLEGKTIILKETEVIIDKLNRKIIRFYIDKELKNNAVRKTEECIRRKIFKAIDELK